MRRRARLGATIAGLAAAIVVLAGAAAFAQASPSPGGTMTLSSSANPAVFGQSITFTAQIQPPPLLGGTVSFTIDGKSQGSVPLSSSGSASITISSLGLGNHAVAATYGLVFPQNASLQETVGQAGTTTSISASANPAAAGAPVNFTVSVAPVAPGAGTPSGSVVLASGVNGLGTVALTNGIGVLAISTLPVGNDAITAAYQGDANFKGSSGSLTEAILGPSPTPSPSASKSPSPSPRPARSPTPTLRTSPSPSPSPSPTLPVSGLSPTAAVAPFTVTSPSPTPLAAAKPSSKNSPLALVALIVLLVVGGVAAYVVTQRRRRLG
jgi:hypothetical protein